MTTPRPRTDLPAWRRQVMPWLMALVRLAAGWVVTQTDLLTLVLHGSFMRTMVGAPIRFGIAGLLGAGLLAFAWPRTYLIGFGLLLAGLAAFEWLWQRLGMPSGPLPLFAAAVLAVLAFGEWLSRRVRTRLYA